MKNNMKSTIYNFISIFCLCYFIFLTSCVKNTNIVPYVYVEHNINISLPYYASLNAIGGWVYITGGSEGIIIYRQSYNQFAAYDRHCTYNAENPCGRASVDSTNLFVECSCDGSQYQLYDGLVIQGPASYSLKNYQTSFNSLTNELHIYN